MCTPSTGSLKGDTSYTGTQEANTAYDFDIGRWISHQLICLVQEDEADSESCQAIYYAIWFNVGCGVRHVRLQCTTAMTKKAPIVLRAEILFHSLKKRGGRLPCQSSTITGASSPSSNSSSSSSTCNVFTSTSSHPNLLSAVFFKFEIATSTLGSIPAAFRP